MPMRYGDEGFTLVELMVSVAMLGIIVLCAGQMLIQFNTLSLYATGESASQSLRQSLLLDFSKSQLISNISSSTTTLESTNKCAVLFGSQVISTTGPTGLILYNPDGSVFLTNSPPNGGNLLSDINLISTNWKVMSLTLTPMSAAIPSSSGVNGTASSVTYSMMANLQYTISNLSNPNFVIQGKSIPIVLTLTNSFTVQSCSLSNSGATGPVILPTCSTSQRLVFYTDMSNGQPEWECQ